RFAERCGFADAPYDVLHRWSTSAPDAFWAAVWEFCGVIGERGAIAYRPAPDGGMLGGAWFPDARLNFAENLLRGEPGALAVIAAEEDGSFTRWSRGELSAEVARIANGLRAAGVTVGDRVAGLLPNRIEALVALLAAASIGAIWSSCSPDFGSVAVLDRLGQIAPKVLFAASAYTYAGKRHDIADRLAEIVAGMPSLTHVVVTGEAGLRAAAAVARWSEFGATSEPAYEPLPFAHPLY